MRESGLDSEFSGSRPDNRFFAGNRRTLRRRDIDVSAEGVERAAPSPEVNQVTAQLEERRLTGERGSGRWELDCTWEIFRSMWTNRSCERSSQGTGAQ